MENMSYEHIRHIHLVKIRDLTLKFPATSKEPEHVVLDKLTFGIRDGEILGLIGNSGSGKSLTAYSIVGLTPENARITEGTIKYQGKDLLSMKPAERRRMLGKDIGMIFQEPASALDPLMKVGRSLDEILLSHGIKDKAERYNRISDILKTVGFPDPEKTYERYPHQLSGGQRQRILIAGAVLLSPKLLICDEPTSSLDSVTTVAILDLLRKLCIDMKISILFISHDLSAVKNFCDRVIVMKNGKIVESDTTEDILMRPKNPYTAELLTNARLDPRTLDLTHAECDYSKDPVLSCKGVSAAYTASLWGRWEENKVLSDVDLSIYPSEIKGLIGSSGCGKSTLVKTILGLMKSEGTIKQPEGKIGAVFQDPVSCLNPMHTILWHLKEALRPIRKNMAKEEVQKAIDNAIDTVGLDRSYLNHRPSQLSGGQRQRVAIAMCMITDPTLIIADEPFSSLDATSAAEILKLLAKINREKGVAILMITHNIHIVRAVCTTVAVMDKGKIIEDDKTQRVLEAPESDAARRLLDAEMRLHS
ncbi:MAG: ABC transporter ATP-binding protein [Clostridiales bacterium]|nr:ABC transporter ATP-binding protein [Clostridiales bacterium]